MSPFTTILVFKSVWQNLQLEDVLRFFVFSFFGFTLLLSAQTAVQSCTRFIDKKLSVIQEQQNNSTRNISMRFIR